MNGACAPSPPTPDTRLAAVMMQAGIFQVCFVLGSGLTFFISRTPNENYNGYGTF